MRIAVISDVHLDQYRNTKGHLTDIYETFCFCAESAIQHKANALVVAGDFLNKRQSIDAETLHYTLRCVRATMPFEQVYFLGGNHEYFTDEYNVLRCIPNIGGRVQVVYNKPLVAGKVTLLPWLPGDRLSQEIAADKSTFLISHFPMVGLKYNQSGVSSDKGIAFEQVEKYQHVILGDFHHQQHQHNVWYTGSPLQHDFGETGNTTGFLILDTKLGLINDFQVPSDPAFIIVEVGKAGWDKSLSLEDAHVWFKCDSEELWATVKREVEPLQHRMRSCRVTIEHTPPRRSQAESLDLELTDMEKSFKRYLKAKLSHAPATKKAVYEQFIRVRKEHANKISGSGS